MAETQEVSRAPCRAPA